MRPLMLHVSHLLSYQKGPRRDVWRSPWKGNNSHTGASFYSLECAPAKSLQLTLTLRPHAVACQAPLSEYCSGLPFPSPGDLPYPGIESKSLTSPALAGGFFTTSDTWEALLPYRD